MQKIFFFDIDGTLAMHGQIPPGNLEALRRLKQAGHLTFVCTGRPVFYAEALFGSLVSGYIACNGRYLCYQGHRLHTRTLSAKALASYRETIDALSAGALFLSERAAYAYHLSHAQLCSVQAEYGQERIFAFPAQEDLYSFDLYYAEPAQRDALCRAFEGRLVINDHGGSGSCDCSTSDWDKGSAINYLLGHFGVGRNDAYAFGDGYNDQAMFRIAGHGIAMGNAVDALKAKASYITDTMENDGILKALRHEGVL